MYVHLCKLQPFILSLSKGDQGCKRLLVKLRQYPQALHLSHICGPDFTTSMRRPGLQIAISAPPHGHGLLDLTCGLHLNINADEVWILRMRIVQRVKDTHKGRCLAFNSNVHTSMVPFFHHTDCKDMQQGLANCSKLSSCRIEKGRD